MKELDGKAKAEVAAAASCPTLSTTYMAMYSTLGKLPPPSTRSVFFARIRGKR